jgi:hypothetical protein
LVFAEFEIAVRHFDRLKRFLLIFF